MRGEFKRTADLTDADYARAVAIITDGNNASTSYLQRTMGLGYNAAAKLMERAEDDGIVSRPNAAGKREVLPAATTIATLTAQLAEARAMRGAVKIKPLVWEERYGYRVIKGYKVIKAKAITELGEYHIDVRYQPCDRKEDAAVETALYIRAGIPLNGGFYHGKEDGQESYDRVKAMMQEDHDARILRAIDATAALSSIKREAEDAGIKIGLRACAELALDCFDQETVTSRAILALTTDEARKLGEEE